MQVEDQSIGGVDYSIELINHTLDKENILDIKPMVSEFVYSEDINIPFTSLTLLIADSLGLAELFPLVGYELIGIKIKSNTQENYIQKLFKINSISNRKILQERSHVYVIEALSLEFFKNKTSSFERSYKGKTGSDIVKNVYENQLKSVYYDEVAVIPKPLSVEESSNLITVNSNTQSPFNFIKQVSHYSYNTEYKSSVYRFYEDQTGFNFKTINGFFKNDPVQDFFFGHSYGKFTEKLSPYQLINGVTFGHSFNSFNSLNLGLFDSSTDIIDPITKTYVEKSFNYYDDFNNLTHLDNFPILSKVTKFKGLNGSSSSNYISARYNNKKKYTDVVPYISERITASNDPHLFFENQRYTFSMEHIAQVQSLSNYKMDITVPGDSKLKVGDIVNVFVPQNSLEEEKLKKYVLHFGQDTSKFFVNAVKHQYIQSGGYFSTILNLSKESFNREVQVDNGGGD